MIDQGHLRVERERAGRAIGRHQRAIAAPHPPVDPGVLVSIHVEDRDGIEFAAIDVSRDRIDHRVPAIAGLQIRTGGAVAAAFRRLVACGGCADDGDIDFGGEGHGLASEWRVANSEWRMERHLYGCSTRYSLLLIRYSPAHATASLAFSARLRSLASRNFLRSRI